MNYRTLAVTSHPSSIGRYILHQPIARGGMATVHVARLVVAEGVTRLVAAKRLHPHCADDPELVEMFRDEARIASRIHHPNVVPVLDVLFDGEEVVLVQEYVHGVPLSVLLKHALMTKEPVPFGIALAIISGVLAGLHAAHEAKDDDGVPLGVIHRDVSPQNILVSVDGVPRLVDFGIAKSAASRHHTREGLLKGKLAYMAPEQLRFEPVSRAADIYAVGVLLWELLLNRRFYDGKNDAKFMRAAARGSLPTPTEALELERGVIPPERWAQVFLLEPLVRRAMAAEPEARFSTAAEMAAALAEVAPSATAIEVGRWMRVAGSVYLEKRENILRETWEHTSCAPFKAASDHQATVSASFPRHEEVRRRSGARMRLDAVTLDARSEICIEAQERNRRARAVRSKAMQPKAVQRPRFDVRSLVPWMVVVGLLVVVGVLSGMVFRRELAAVMVAPLRVPTAEGVSHLSAIGGDLEPVVRIGDPIESSIRIATIERAKAVSSSSVEPAPVSAPGCDPPFYLDGERKVFKTGCVELAR